MGDNTSVDDILITSHLDTSPVTSSSCLDPSSASAKSSTLTVLSANKIFENKCHDESPKSKQQKSIGGNNYKQLVKIKSKVSSG